MGTEFDAHNKKTAAHQRLVDNSPRVTAQRKQIESAFGMPVQRQGAAEEEELLQGKFAPFQRQGTEEEELLQGKFEAIQRQGPEDEELQRKQGLRTEMPAQFEPDPAPRENNTGLSDNLKSGIESLSGMSMDNVKVHYNSSQPAQLNALAYAQGTDIHLASGQEQHLPHEAWHVVQQAQGRVKPTMQMKDGVPVNDDAGLEHEADLMGANALQVGRSKRGAFEFPIHSAGNRHLAQSVQLQPIPGNVTLDMATCSLLGVQHEDTKSFATVKSEAWMSSPLHKVLYEIKWDAAVVPGGKHLGQQDGVASDWITDLSPYGVPIGVRNDPNAPYFADDGNHDPQNGKYFLFNDGIQQARKYGGSWWFRLKVVDQHGGVLSESHPVEVPWGPDPATSV
jgi:hypothetical protein